MSAFQLFFLSPSLYKTVRKQTTKMVLVATCATYFKSEYDSVMNYGKL